MPFILTDPLIPVSHCPLLASSDRTANLMVVVVAPATPPLPLLPLLLDDLPYSSWRLRAPMTRRHVQNGCAILEEGRHTQPLGGSMKRLSCDPASASSRSKKMNRLRWLLLSQLLLLWCLPAYPFLPAIGHGGEVIDTRRAGVHKQGKKQVLLHEGVACRHLCVECT